MSRIRIFTGHFGSGKTEVSINYALKLKREGNKVAIIDIDIVNPYFCLRDVKKYLEENGIRVIASNPSFSNAELSVVTPEVLAAFNDKSYEVVMDVGGDDQGAVVLGQYNRYFKEEPYDMYFVINNNRPLTARNNSIKEYIRTIEDASRLKITHLISNSNISYETKTKDILKGDEKVARLSKELNLPYAFTACRKDLISDIEDKVQGELLPLDIYMKLPWS